MISLRGRQGADRRQAGSVRHGNAGRCRARGGNRLLRRAASPTLAGTCSHLNVGRPCGSPKQAAMSSCISGRQSVGMGSRWSLHPTAPTTCDAAASGGDGQSAGTATRWRWQHGHAPRRALLGSLGRRPSSSQGANPPRSLGRAARPADAHSHTHAPDTPAHLHGVLVVPRLVIGHQLPQDHAVAAPGRWKRRAENKQ